MMALLLATGLGCRPADTWAEVGADCDVAGETLWTVTVDPLAREACASRVARDLGYDGDLLDLADEQSSLQKAGLGALAIASLDVGETGDLLRDVAAPPSFAAELAEMAADLRLEDEEPGAHLLYAWVADRVERTRLDEPGQRWSFEPPGTLWLPSTWSSVDAWDWATLLLHLAGHAEGRPHTDCRDGWTVDEGTDTTWDGTHGLATWVLLRVLERAPEERREEAVLRLMHEAGTLCPGTEVPDEILARGGFEQVDVAR